MSVLYTNQTPLISRKGKLCCTVSARYLIPTRIVSSLSGGCYHLLSSLFGFTEQSSIRCCCSSSRLLLVTVLEMFHVACMSTPFLKFYRNAAVCFFSTSTSSGGFTIRIVIVVIVAVIGALILAVLLALGFVLWRRRHPPRPKSPNKGVSGHRGGNQGWVLRYGNRCGSGDDDGKSDEVGRRD